MYVHYLGDSRSFGFPRCWDCSRFGLGRGLPVMTFLGDRFRVAGFSFARCAPALPQRNPRKPCMSCIRPISGKKSLNPNCAMSAWTDAILGLGDKKRTVRVGLRVMEVAQLGPVAAVLETWRELADHAGPCLVCAGPYDRLRARCGSGGREVMRAHYGALCETGALLAWSWDEACMVAHEASPIRALSVRMGTWSGPYAQERARVLAAIPPGPYARLATMTDAGARDAEIRALERAQERPGTPERVGAAQEPRNGGPGPYTCRECGRPVRAPGMLCYRCFKHAE